RPSSGARSPLPICGVRPRSKSLPAQLLLVGRRPGVMVGDGGITALEDGAVFDRPVEKQLANVVAELLEHVDLLVALPVDVGEHGGRAFGLDAREVVVVLLE